MIYLITGGARSGKSTFAESLYKNVEDVVYIATSKIYDKEMQDRVDTHKKSRPSKWRTYEGTYDLINAVSTEKNYLLDCITGLVSNIMFDNSKDMDYISLNTQEEIEEKIIFELENLINKVKKDNNNLILVTNEVGSSIVPEHHISRVFRDIQGRINQKIGNLSDEVYLVCCGIPVKIK